MKLQNILGYVLFFAAAIGIFVLSTYTKYQEGVGIIYDLRNHGLDIPAAIGLGVGLLYLIYALFFKGKSNDQDNVP